jgi:predicted glycoside hydrolase/deacetylase ChbG (UPF0249 family)
MITVCADDYAQNEAVSKGILQLLEKKKIHATSCLVTTQYWPEHAVWLKKNKHAKVGLHLNLTEGEGFMGLNALLIKSHLRLLNKTKLKAQITAQLEAFAQHMGREPDYIDGHQHVHHLPQVRDALMDVYLARYPKRDVFMRTVYSIHGPFEMPSFTGLSSASSGKIPPPSPSDVTLGLDPEIQSKQPPGVGRHKTRGSSQKECLATRDTKPTVILAKAGIQKPSKWIPGSSPRMTVDSFFSRLSFCSKGAIKSFIIRHTGAYQLHNMLHKHNIDHNEGFAGVYHFDEVTPEGFLALLTAWHKSLRPKGWIMCHPGLASEDATDPLCKSRAVEFGVLLEA